MKNILTAIFMLYYISGKSQTMAIHGTSATQFVIYYDGAPYSIFGSELWYDSPTSGDVTVSDLTVNPMTSFASTPTKIGETIPAELPEPNLDGDIYLSCNAARDIFGIMHVKCGPFYENGITNNGIFSCSNSNHVSCRIACVGIIFWLPDGEFQPVFP